MTPDKLELLAFEDPDHPGNGPEYRTMKLCVERGCTRIAGTKWSKLWCFECNVERMRRIERNLEALEKRFGGGE